MKGFFITGTGTEIGKTFVTAALCHQLRRSGKTVRVLKPVLSGYSETAFEDTDTAILLAAAGLEKTGKAIDATTPWRFTAPLAPNMAAAREGKKLDFTAITAFCRNALAGPEDFCLIEGAGGAFSPLTDNRLNIDLATALTLPAIVVSGSYLGAIGHAIAALEALRARNIAIRCLIVSESEENPVTLTETMAAIRHHHPETAIHGLPYIHHKEGPWRFADPVAGAVVGTE